MACQKIHDFISGEEKDLAPPPAADPAEARLDTASLLHPDEVARDLIERHHRMLAELRAEQPSE
jgi:hypothetical protein